MINNYQILSLIVLPYDDEKNSRKLKIDEAINENKIPSDLKRLEIYTKKLTKYQFLISLIALDVLSSELEIEYIALYVEAR